VRFPASPPQAVEDMATVFDGDESDFDGVREDKLTTRHAKDVILAKTINANDDVYFEDRLAA
jgi:hypothetical protein